LQILVYFVLWGQTETNINRPAENL